MSDSPDLFIRNLLKSGLISEADLTAFQAGSSSIQKPADGKALARELVRAGKLTKYQAQCVYSGQSAGLVIDQYTVLDKIGEGGMGLVLKGEHRRMKRAVAIKAVLAKRLKSKDAVDRFHREVEAAAKLNHPNIVTAYDAREQDGVQYLIMEFVEGQDLATTIKELGRVPYERALDYCLQTARGLEFAHAQNIVHRDIKPANLLLSKQGVVKILDMGLARLQGATSSVGDVDQLTQSGEMMGTCDYMAPEQALDSRKADGRADIYALGCTLFRLVTGERPYVGDSVMQILMAHREAPIPSIRARRPEVPAEVDALFAKMVAKKAADRYQSMAEVIAAIDNILHPPKNTAYDEESTHARSLRENLSFLTPEGSDSKSPVAEVDNAVAPHQATVTFRAEDDTGSRSAAAGAAPPVAPPPLVTPPPLQAKPQAEARTASTSGIGKRSTRKTKVRVKPSGLLIGAAGLLALGVICLIAAMFVFSGSSGTIAFVNDDSINTGSDLKVTVSRDGKEYKVVEVKGDTTLTLPAGKYDLAVSGTVNVENSHLALSDPTITVTRDHRLSVHIKLADNNEQPEEVQKHAAEALGKPVDYNNSIGMNFKLIPAGSFKMGSSPEFVNAMLSDSAKWHSDPDWQYETAHQVKITHPFYLGASAVTQEKYELVMHANPSYFSANGGGKDIVAGQDTTRLPVENVPYDDAVAFCKRLSERPDEKAAGRHYRLPTEAEWEYACRAGTTTAWHFGDDPSALKEYAWFKDNSNGRTHPVGALKPNPWGLFDMHGNIREACADRYDNTYYRYSGKDDPCCQSASEDIVVRGGSFKYPFGLCRSADRHHVPAGYEAEDNGFRVLLEIEHKEPIEEPKREFVPVHTAGVEQWTEWKDLFDGKTLDGWKTSQPGEYGIGHAVIANGLICLDVNEGTRGGVAIVTQTPIPTVNYELRVEAKRMLGADCASIVFPIGDAHCTLYVPDGAGIVKLRDINRGDDGRSNATDRQLDFKNDVWHDVVLSVFAKSITVSIDSEKIIDLPTAGHSFTARSGNPLLFPLGVYSFSNDKSGCSSQIRKIRIRELKPPSESAGNVRSVPMKRPAPVALEIKPEPLPEFKPGQPLSKLALVAEPAALAGVRSWTIETVRHRGPGSALAFSPDGQRLAIGGEDGTIRLLNPADGNLIRLLIGHAISIRSISWSPDSRWLVSAGIDGPAIVWDADSGRMMRHDLFDAGVNWVDWSPDGRHVAGLSALMQDVVVVDVVDGTRATIPCQDVDAKTRSFGDLSWSPDGNRLAYFRNEEVSQTEHPLHIWNIKSNCEAATLDVRGKNVNQLYWSPDGTMLSFRSEGVASIVDPGSGNVLYRIKRDRLAWSPDGQTIGFTNGSSLELRNTRTWSLRCRGNCSGYELAFSSGGVLAASGGRDFALFDAKTGARKTDLRGYNSFQWQTVDLNHTGTRLVTQLPYARATIWDTASGLPDRPFVASDRGFYALSEDGVTLATIHGNSGPIEVKSTSTNEALTSIPCNNDPYFAFSDNGKSLLVWDPNLAVWDIASNSVVFRNPPESWVQAALNPDATLIAIASGKGAKVFDVKTGELVKTFDGADAQPGRLAWSPSGKFLAGAGHIGGIDVWDVASGKHLGDRESLAKAACFQEGRYVQAFAWLDNNTLVIGNCSGACAWSLTSRRIVREIPGGNDYYGMNRCFFGPGTGKHDGKVAFTGASAVHLRSLDDGRPLYNIILLSDDPQKCAVVGPSGHWRGPMDGVCYVVEKTDGAQETLTPEEFEKKYGWKNDPAKAVGK